MAAAATRTVTGFLTNISAQEIADAVLRFDLKPAYAAVGDTIVIGVQDGAELGELVTPLSDDGSWTVDLVAQENPSYTIIVTAEGPNIEAKNPPSFEIYPPPAAGSGDVGVGSLIVPGSIAPDVGTPFRLVNLRDVSVTDIADGDVMAWSAAAQLFLNTPQTGGGGGGGGVTEGELTAALATKVDNGDSRLADARTPTAHAASHASDGSDPISLASLGGSIDKAAIGLGNVDNTADTAKPVSTAQAAAIALKLDAAKVGVASGVPSMDSSLHILYDWMPPGTTFTWEEVAGVYPDRPSSRIDISFNYVGVDTPTIGGTGAVDGVDSWDPL